MKRYFKALALSASAAILAVSLCSCSGASTSSDLSSNGDASSESSTSVSVSSLEPSEVVDIIMNDIGIKFPGMAEVKEDRFDQYYDIDVSAVESFSAYICGSGAYPDEIAVFKMNSEAVVSDAKSALESRIDTLTKTYKDYKPDEMYKINGNNIISKGCYVAIIICSDNELAVSEFEKRVG